ncbi:MAG: hypothetical protein LBE38_04085 [Deltaproteobacteria bacterium]|jgi:tetratricopeptide (TPR) repeat protein|nr:hypothetical protein [Deltaproteobacteria bacterium]
MDKESSNNPPEHLDPYYKGLYLADRPVTLGASSVKDMYKGVLSDLDTLYPKDLSPVLEQMSSLQMDMALIRKRRKKPNSRDLSRLALMDNELTVVQRRLNLHDQRVRGAFRELSQYMDTIGQGFEEYLVSLGSLLFFLETYKERLKNDISLLEDPGQSASTIVKRLSGTVERRMAEIYKLSAEIVPPEDFSGRSIQEIIPKLPPPPSLPMKTKPLLEKANSYVALLESARLAALDALLLCEKKLLALFKEHKTPLEGQPQKSTPQEKAPAPASQNERISQETDPSSSPELKSPQEHTGDEKLTEEKAQDLVEGDSPEPQGKVEDTPPEPQGALEDTSPEPQGELEDTSPEPQGALEDDSDHEGLISLAKTKKTTILQAGLTPPIEKLHAPAPAHVPDISPLMEEKEEEVFPPRRSPLRVMTALSIGLALALIMVFVSSRLFNKDEDGSVYIFNGLGTIVVVSLPQDKSYTLMPFEKFQQRYPRGQEITFETRTQKGVLIESFLTMVPKEKDLTLIYNVAGASPFVEWLVHYGITPNNDLVIKQLGAPRILTTSADFILESPPRSMKIKGDSQSMVSINPMAGLHPEMILEFLSTSESQTRMISVHASWDSPQEIFLPLWLQLLEDFYHEEGMEILEHRFREYPDDVWTLMQLIRYYPLEKRKILCDFISQSLVLGAHSASDYFLALECAKMEDPNKASEFVELSKRFPDYPLITRGLGMYYFSLGSIDNAIVNLNKAFSDNPQTLLSDMVLLARLNHYAGETAPVILSEMGPWSPQVRALVEPEAAVIETSNIGEQNSDYDVWGLLAQGKVLEALEAAGPNPDPNTLILIAASDGAPPELLDRLANIDPHDLNPQGGWALFGLLTRNDMDSSLVEDYLMNMARDPDLVLGAILLIHENRMLELLSLIQGRNPQHQGFIALAAVLSHPHRDLTGFRKIAKGFLFIGERPYML